MVAEPGHNHRYSDGFMAAATRIGAKSYTVMVPRMSVLPDGSVVGYGGEGVRRGGAGVTPLRANPAAVDALRHADLIIDHVGLLFTLEMHDLLGGGARILTVNQPIDHLVALFPHRGHAREGRGGHRPARRGAHAARHQRGGHRRHLPAQPVPGDRQYGYVDTPGRWDHWPSGGFVYTGGDDDGVDGTVVLAPATC